jgi:hypothetical protein
MPAEIDFLAIATDPGANVTDQASFAAAAWLGDGKAAGLLTSADFNKIIRQSSSIAAVIAQYISAKNGGIDVLDNGNIATLLTNFAAAVSLGAGVRPAREVTASANFQIALADYRIGMRRTAGVAAMQITLPPVTDANIGQEWLIEDLQGNFFAAPITVLPSSGTIAGQAQRVLNVDRQSWKFGYYGNTRWSVGGP